ncbi:hypothetical protein PVAP13_7KG225055 [Panicum virgatum]|uniref:Uncharacterized protein n=1 Tax=Panicum virgatum TaxID=38727 RepID=A0A8T0QK53_PANVG|nr:hypothetical protein PVAP13_7KG225055 [Panicum virgatum]
MGTGGPRLRPRRPGPAARGAPRGATAATGGAARLAPAISLLSPMDALQPAMSGCQGPVAATRRTRHQGRSGEYAIGTRRRTPPQSSGARVQLAGCQDARCVRNYWAGRLHPLESEDGAKNRLDKRHQILQSLSLTPIRRGLRFSSSRFRRPWATSLIFLLSYPVSLYPLPFSLLHRRAVGQEHSAQPSSSSASANGGGGARWLAARAIHDATVSTSLAGTCAVASSRRSSAASPPLHAKPIRAAHPSSTASARARRFRAGAGASAAADSAESAMDTQELLDADDAEGPERACAPRRRFRCLDTRKLAPCRERTFAVAAVE